MFIAAITRKGVGVISDGSFINEEAGWVFWHAGEISEHDRKAESKRKKADFPLVIRHYSLVIQRIQLGSVTEPCLLLRPRGEMFIAGDFFPAGFAP